MDTQPTTPSNEEKLLSDPSWEKWSKEQVETISNILSNVFKVEDAARQTKTPSRLLKNPSMMEEKQEEEIRKKLKLIRQQLAEYEQMVQLGLRRIDNALEIIQPPKPPEREKVHPLPQQKPSGLKNWIKKLFKL